MGKIDVDVRGSLQVLPQTSEDIAALRAALRSVPGVDALELKQDVGCTVDAENPSNLLALHGAGFEWSHAALSRALDELIPYALSQVSMHLSTRSKFFKRMMAEAQATKARPGHSADATTNPP